jgi:hypothetical protein
MLGATAVAIAVLVAGVIVTGGGRGARSAPVGTAPEGIPVPKAVPLAPVTTARAGQPIDGIQCDRAEQVAYHIHARLAIFVNGVPKQVPHGIGVAPPMQTAGSGSDTFVTGGGCLYWLHTHAADGVIHLESPSAQVYTLGQFFDIWGQPLSATQVGPATGQVTAWVNGSLYSGDPAAIRLQPHDVIQLDVGAPVVQPQAVSFSGTGL